ncbi:MAG: transglutaminase-like domain-containing protein, partial [Oscillospiraceae bacterium]|nr:transglutaminase-like domain-containing protein [Oscillospiraceae bacterium]
MKQEKAKKAKVKTKLKKNAVPFWTSGEAEQNNASLFMNLSIRFALLCSATAGVSLLLIQIYRIPVNTAPVIFWAVCSSLFFNVVFVYVRFRYAFILFAVIFYIYQRVEDVLFNLGCLGDFLLIAIHGGILHTAGFASRPDFIVNELLTYNFPEALEFQTGLQNGVILVTVVLALVFALSARGKFIGSILIACTIVLIPAIASQKATYVPALTLLAASMLGLYSVWASHEQSILKAMKRRKQKTGPFIPRVHKHSVNGALTACIALIAAGIAQSIIPVEKTRDVIDYFSDRSDQIIEWAYRIGERFESGIFSTIPTLEHSGYMPGGGINPSGGLSINNPTTSRQPVLNVTLENNDAPVYLRNGIGAAFNPVRGEWNVNSRFDNMNLFPDNFYPEHEYLVFRQKAAQAFGYNANRLIGRQWVEIEYLVRSPHVMLPTLPHMPDYKSDSRFTWSHDSILRKRGSQRPQTYHWDILYPKPSHELGTALDRIQTYISNQRALMYGESSAYGVTDARGDYIHLEFSGEDMPPTGALRIFVEEYGLTAAEYLSLLEEYEEMVYDVYTQTVPGESGNMQQLMRNAFAPYIVHVIVNPVLDARAIYTIDEDDIAYASVSERFSDYEKVNVLANYLKTEYTYSLITDNNLGDNTLLGNFLFETREGHCALFATAMTLALREEGIPARFVTGYVVGSGVPEAVNAGYRYTILARDLHAWVEAYFEGIGWIPF